MDEKIASHFAIEVEDLSKKISILKESVNSLLQSMEIQKSEAQKCENEVEHAKNSLSKISSSLSESIGFQTEFPENSTLSLEQVTSLQSHLNNLSEIETSLIVSEQEKNSTSLVPFKNEDIVTTMQLWQNVFEQTLGNYNHLTAELAKQQSKEISIKIWENHMNQVSSNLQIQLSDSYYDICKELSNSVLHKKLLMQNQQQLIMRYPTENMVTLQNVATRNNELLEKVEQKSLILRDRQAMWDTYVSDQERFLVWLREMEKEKQQLNLKHVALRRLPKLVQKIKMLLEKIPHGEKIYKKLASEHSTMRDHFSDSFMSSIKSESHSYQVKLNKHNP